MKKLSIIIVFVAFSLIGCSSGSSSGGGSSPTPLPTTSSSTQTGYVLNQGNNTVSVCFELGCFAQPVIDGTTYQDALNLLAGTGIGVNENYVFIGGDNDGVSRLDSKLITCDRNSFGLLGSCTESATKTFAGAPLRIASVKLSNTNLYFASSTTESGTAPVIVNCQIVNSGVDYSSCVDTALPLGEGVNGIYIESNILYGVSEKSNLVIRIGIGPDGNLLPSTFESQSVLANIQPLGVPGEIRAITITNGYAYISYPGAPNNDTILICPVNADGSLNVPLCTTNYNLVFNGPVGMFSLESKVFVLNYGLGGNHPIGTTVTSCSATESGLNSSSCISSNGNGTFSVPIAMDIFTQYN